MTRAFVAVLTVGLLALASISNAGVAIQRQSPDSGISEVTSRSATTPDGTPNETTEFPPGTSESGIDDATLLLETHRSVLADETYSMQANVTRIDELAGGTESSLGFDIEEFGLTGEKGVNRTRLTIADEGATYENGSSSQSYWVTDEEIALKQTSTDSFHTTRYEYIPPTGRQGALFDRAASFYVEPSFILEPYLLGFDYEYSGTVTDDNRTLYEFTSTGVNASAVETHDLTEFSDSNESINATVLIDERGVIRSFETSNVRTRGNETKTTGLRYEIPRLGNVTPTKPSWVTTELPNVEASVSADGRVVVLNHTGGMTVSTANVLLYSSSLSASTDFTGRFEPGDTLYLSVGKADTSRVLVSRNEYPEVNESLVRFESENISILPWRMVYEESERESTTLEMHIRDDASNRSLPTTTGTAEPNNSSTTSQYRITKQIERLFGKL
jgi:hypothetical protein